MHFQSCNINDARPRGIAETLVFNNGADAFAFSHLRERLVYVLEFDAVGDHRVEVNLAFHIQVDNVWKVD